jgi:hypothetical protein
MIRWARSRRFKKKKFDVRTDGLACRCRMYRSKSVGAARGCQMVYFLTENPHSGKIWRVLQWKITVYFGQFSRHLVYFTYCPLVYFVVIWYILWSFGIFSPFWYAVPRKIWQPWCCFKCCRTKNVCRKVRTKNATSCSSFVMPCPPIPFRFKFRYAMSSDTFPL